MDPTSAEVAAACAEIDAHVDWHKLSDAQYPYDSILRPGPNVSHRRSENIDWAGVGIGLAITAIVLAALVEAVWHLSK